MSDLRVPELGGKFDPRNPSHKMLMSVFGGMREYESRHVQARLRAAMDAQVINEGRHQNGRAPYGYYYSRSLVGALLRPAQTSTNSPMDARSTSS
jgi:DNA invertase Pin-like site-specific DNA recombinase